jgi:thiol-disulfide isomerase/thioredoxin
MKSLRFLLVTLAAWCAGALPAQEKPVTPADTAFAELRSLADAQMTFMRDPRWRTMTAADRERFTAAGADLVIALGERILADYPADPRRWDAVGAMAAARPAFDGPDAAQRKAAWEKRRADLGAQALASSDIPPAVLEVVVANEVIASAYRTVRTPDLPRARRALDVLAERDPMARNRETMETVYLEALQRTDAAGYEARLKELAASPDRGLAQLAEAKLTAASLATKPVELKFPDLDGREIDLVKYRGKVVLLDFWATWCVPCMEEMPNLKAVYQKYHAQGFEIIGITDDIVPKDPAHPRGTEKNLEMLKAFLAKEAMPWPQLWDTRPKDRPGVKGLLRQFDVQSLPTGMLFDQNGRLVTTDNRGEKLEANVRRLLGL